MRLARHDAWRITAALFLFGLFGCQFYRVATLSITVDEARVYFDFIRPDPAVVLKEYDVAHHILQTYLSWYFVRRWGGSELVLRIPALLASAAYFVFVWKFSARLFRSGAPFLAAVLVLALNPLILDHLSIARGYGLALAFFAWMLYATVRFFDSAGRNSLTAAGILGGLSVASNLTFLTPVCALAAVTMLAYVWKRPAGPLNLVDDYWGPGVVVCALLVLLPLTHANPKNFYFGSDTLFAMLQTLIMPNFDRHYWGAAANVLGYGLGILAMMAALAGAARSWLRSKPSAALIATCTLATALAAMVLAGAGFHVPYPNARTGLWIVFLLMASALAGAAALIPASRWIQPALIVVCAIAATASIAQYDAGFIWEWRFNSATKHFMDVIRRREAGHNRPFSVSGNPEYKFPADYYRVRWNMRNMRDMPFGGPEPGGGYYLLYGTDVREKAADLKAAIIEEDKLCICVLAAR